MDVITDEQQQQPKEKGNSNSILTGLDVDFGNNVHAGSGVGGGRDGGGMSHDDTVSNMATPPLPSASAGPSSAAVDGGATTANGGGDADVGGGADCDCACGDCCCISM